MEKERKRLRNFAFLVYLESGVEFIDKLKSSGLQGFVILHDKDDKKPHYHILIKSLNALAYNSCLKLANECRCANNHVENVVNFKGYSRYLCHLDNDDKYKYNVSEVISLGGLKYKEVIKTEMEITNKIVEIIKYCKLNNVYSFSRLVDYSIEERRDWFKIVCNASYGRVIRDYIKSLYWEEKTQI